VGVYRVGVMRFRLQQLHQQGLRMESSTVVIYSGKWSRLYIMLRASCRRQSKLGKGIHSAQQLAALCKLRQVMHIGVDNRYSTLRCCRTALLQTVTVHVCVLEFMHAWPGISKSYTCCSSAGTAAVRDAPVPLLQLAILFALVVLASTKKPCALARVHLLLRSTASNLATRRVRTCASVSQVASSADTGNSKLMHAPAAAVLIGTTRCIPVTMQAAVLPRLL
jgi:hypothetical protein